MDVARHLTELGAADRFEIVTGGDTFGVGKPDQLPILKTLEMLNATREKTVMVGDSRPDIEGAKNAGISSIAVDFGYTSELVSDFAPDGIISHFDDLWDAVGKLFPQNAEK